MAVSSELIKGGNIMPVSFELISGLRKAHLYQLASYLHARDREGWYYGPKAQFEARHKDLLTWIDSAIEYAESDEVRMPRTTKVNKKEK